MKPSDADNSTISTFVPTCGHCKAKPAVFRISCPPVTDQDGNERQPLIEIKPVDICLDCLGIEVEEQKRLPPISPVGQRAWSW